MIRRLLDHWFLNWNITRWNAQPPRRTKSGRPLEYGVWPVDDSDRPDAWLIK